MTFTYQWLRYDEDIVGETSSTISYGKLMLDDTIAECQMHGSMTTTSDSVMMNVRGEYINISVL